MSDVKTLVQKALDLDRRLAEKFDQDPNFGPFLGVFRGKRSVFGLRVTNGNVPHEFTAYYDGIYAKELKEGLNDDISVQVMPELVIRPVFEIPEEAMRQMLEDEDYVLENPFEATQALIPKMTIKFKH